MEESPTVMPSSNMGGMKLRSKLLLGFIVVVGLTMFLGTITYINIQDMGTNFSFLVEHDLKVLQNAQHLEKFVVDAETGQRGFIITGKDEFLEPYNDGINGFNELVNEEKLLVSDNPSQVQRLETIEKLFIEWQTKAGQPEIDLARQFHSGDVTFDDVSTLLAAGTGKNILDNMRAEFKTFIQIENDLKDQRFITSTNVENNTKIVVVVVAMISGIVGLFLAFYLSRAITKPIIQVKELLNKVRQSMDIVDESVVSITKSSEQMSTSSQQVAATIQQINQGSQKTASSITDTTKIIADMGISIKNLTKRAEDTSLVVENVKKSSEEQSKSAEAASAKMNEITVVTDESASKITKLAEQSEKITSMLQIIRDVADQTNLLSLNAAIEAARAGEAGRGFAVVADEVRRLAESSSKSAQEIGVTINQIQDDAKSAVLSMEKGKKSVSEGKEVISVAIDSLKDSVENIQQITENVVSLSKQSGQQLPEMDRITKSITDIATVAEENASAAEEAASTSEEHSASSQEIMKTVNLLSERSKELKTAISSLELPAV